MGRCRGTDGWPISERVLGEAWVGSAHAQTESDAMTPHRILILSVTVLLLLPAVGLGHPLPPQVNVTGHWLFNNGTGGFGGAAGCAIEQQGVSLAGDCFDGATGSIDPTTGAFSLSSAGTCPSPQISGSASMDSLQGSATTEEEQCMCFYPNELCNKYAAQLCYECQLGCLWNCQADPNCSCTAIGCSQCQAACASTCSIAYAQCCVQGCYCSTPATSTFMATRTCGNQLVESGEACDDGNRTSGDGCSSDCLLESGWSCTGQPSVCTPIRLCSSTPQISCRQSKTSLLLVLNKGDASKNLLKWDWVQGDATTSTEFADPTSTAEYAFCIYGGTAAALTAEAELPPSPQRWKVSAAGGYRYKNPLGGVNGITKVLLKPGAQDKSVASLQAKGADLPQLPLPLPAPVTVQLMNGSNGLCWGASYDVSQITTDTANEVRAKTP